MPGLYDDLAKPSGLYADLFSDDESGGESADVAAPLLQGAEKISDVAAANRDTGIDRWLMQQEPLLNAGEHITQDLANPPKYLVNLPNRLAGQPDMPPLISPEQGVKLAKFFSPVESSEGSAAQGVENFAGKLASGLTAPENIAGLMAGTKYPQLVGAIYQGMMAADLPGTIQRLRQAGSTSEQIEESLNALSTMGFMAAIQKHLQRPEPVPQVGRFQEQNEQFNFEPKPPTEGAPNASGVPVPESVSELEVRPPVGESAPLRQQGETPGARPEEPAPAPAAGAGEILSGNRPVSETASAITAMTPQEWDTISKTYAGKISSGATGFGWDLGAEAKTPEDVAALKKLAEDLRKRFAAEKTLGPRLNAAEEAYQAATGVNLKGEPALGLLRQKEPGYEPPVPHENALSADQERGGTAGPVPKASELKPDMATARAVAEMSPDEFVAKAGGFNRINLELGRKATPEDLAELRQLHARANERAQAAMEKAVRPDATEEDKNNFVKLSSLPQFFNEAIAEATKAGVKETPPKSAPVKPAPINPGATEPIVAEGMTLSKIKQRIPFGYEQDSVRIENGRIVAKEKPTHGGEWHFVSLKKAEASPYAPAGPKSAPVKPEAQTPAKINQSKPSGFIPPPVPERFETLEDVIKYRQAHKQAELDFYKSLGLGEQDAAKMWRASDARSNLDVESIERKLSPENRARLEEFSTGEGSAMYQFDRMFDPGQLVGEQNKGEISTRLVGAMGKSEPLRPGLDDRFIFSVAALRALEKHGGTWSNVARALDEFTTRNSGSQGDKEFLFKEVAAKIRKLAHEQGITLPEGELSGERGGPAIKQQASDKLAAKVEAGHVAPKMAEAIRSQNQLPPPTVKEAAPALTAERAKVIADAEKALADMATEEEAMRQAASKAEDAGNMAEGHKIRNDLSSAERKVRGLDLRAAISVARGSEGIDRMHRETAQFRGQPEPARNVTITSKMIKGQKEYLLHEVDDAIKEAGEEGAEKITIDVPGDGSWTIRNNKRSLTKFREIVQKQFPSAVKTTDAPTKPSQKGRTAPAVADPKAADLPKIVTPFLSEDQSRFAIQSAYADGTQIVATNGRMLMRIVSDKAPGTPAEPVRTNAEGKIDPTLNNIRFPNFNQVLDRNAALVMGGLDTGQLFQLARMAEIFHRASGSDQLPSLKLLVNKDRSLGVEATSQGDHYEHNVQPDAHYLGKYDARYLLDLAAAARRLGNEKIDLYRGEDGGTPLMIYGQNFEAALMAVRDEPTAPQPDPASKFGTVAGKSAHGRVAPGLTPLEHPDAARGSGTIDTPAGKMSVDTEGGNVSFHLLKGPNNWVEIGKVKANELGEGDTLGSIRGKAIAALVRKSVSQLSANTVNETTRKLMDELKKLESERAKVVEEGQRRMAPPPPANPGPQSLGILPPGSHYLQAAIDWVKSLPEKGNVMLAQLAGKAAPRTSLHSVESGNAIVHYASAKLAGPVVARSMATDVLGEHHLAPAFGQKLGAVLVEDRLRAIRQGLIAAGDQAGAEAVETVVGKPWSPLRSNRAFHNAISDPEIQAAIERHKATVQPAAQSAHAEAGGKLAGPGLNTGAFVNLKALFDDNAENLATGGRGNLENPLRRLSRFFREARGTAQRYEIDYRTLAERMVTGNFEESAKRAMYSQLATDGLAEINDPGDPRPVLGGKPAVKFTIERRGVPSGDGRGRTYIKNLWVRSDIAPEVRQALNTDGAVGNAGLAAAANVINKIQLAGPTDAVWHTANMLGSIAGSQGGRTLLGDLARKMPGVNILDAIGRTVASGIGVLRDNPDIQRQLAELAQIGALRGQHPAGLMGRLIQFVDRAGRLVRDDMYQNLVRRGLVENSEASRREWVNQMGQYNGRLMGQFQRFFKEAGFSPFIVAGRNFNRMAMRRLLLDPGIKASGPLAAMEMRGIEALGTVATLIAIPTLINFMINGNPSGRPGVKVGQIDTGKTDRDGNAIVIDPAQWTGLRRGLRISGAQAALEGARAGQGARRITRTMAHDILGGLMHPWTGPAVTAGSVAATGYDPRFYKESSNPKDVGANVTAALKQLNPVAAALLKAREKDTSAAGQLAMSLGGAAGIKAVHAQDNRAQLGQLHSTWMRKNPDPKIRADYERNSESDFAASAYAPLDAALRKNDQKAAVSEIQELLKTEGAKRLMARMQPKSTLFHEARSIEGQFYASLGPAQRLQYQAARREQIDLYRRFVKAWVLANKKP